MPTIESQEDLRLKWGMKTPDEVLDQRERDKKLVEWCRKHGRVPEDND